MEGILNWRICKKCKRVYDVGTNYELCPECRGYFHFLKKCKITKEEKNGTIK